MSMQYAYSKTFNFWVGIVAQQTQVIYSQLGKTERLVKKLQDYNKKAVVAQTDFRSEVLKHAKVHCKHCNWGAIPEHNHAQLYKNYKTSLTKMEHMTSHSLEMGRAQLDEAKGLNGELKRYHHELQDEYSNDNIETFAILFGGDDFENQFIASLDKIIKKCGEISTVASQRERQLSAIVSSPL